MNDLQSSIRRTFRARGQRTALWLSQAWRPPPAMKDHSNSMPRRTFLAMKLCLHFSFSDHIFTIPQDDELLMSLRYTPLSSTNADN